MTAQHQLNSQSLSVIRKGYLYSLWSYYEMFAVPFCPGSLLHLPLVLLHPHRVAGSETERLQKIARARRASAICSLWKIYECLFIPNCTRKIIWLLVNNIQVTISVTLQYFTWQMEATSYVYFIGWKFDMWIQAWKLIHSLQVMYEDWAVSFYRERQSLLTVELKNGPKAKEKVPAVMMRLSRQMFFEWLWNCVQETIEPGTSCFDQNIKKRS